MYDIEKVIDSFSKHINDLFDEKVIYYSYYKIEGTDTRLQIKSKK